LTCWFAQAASRKAMSSSRPKTPLPVIGNLASDTFFGPNLAFGLRVTARESAAVIFCKLLLVIVFPVSKFEANGLRQNEFCRNHGLALSAWQRQLKRRGQRRCKGEGRFVAVELAGRERNGCFHRDDARPKSRQSIQVPQQNRKCCEFVSRQILRRLPEIGLTKHFVRP